MKKKRLANIGLSSIIARKSLILFGFLSIAIVLCLLPFKILVMLMLAICLILIVGNLSISPLILGRNLMRNQKDESEDEYERIKREWKEQIERDQELTQKIEETIIRLIDQNKENKYEHAKIRWKREIMDKKYERRIQRIFSRIRDSDSKMYQHGIKEIQEILALRKSNLVKERASHNIN